MKSRKTWLSKFLVCCGNDDKEYAEDSWRRIKQNWLSGLWNICGCLRPKEPLTRESLYDHNRLYVTPSFGHG